MSPTGTSEIVQALETDHSLLQTIPILPNLPGIVILPTLPTLPTMLIQPTLQTLPSQPKSLLTLPSLQILHSLPNLQTYSSQEIHNNIANMALKLRVKERICQD